jgi:hypothetical protein
MYLFLLDLLIGFADRQVTNPRMGLAAHLEGLMNGTCLIALGAVWQFVRCLLQSRPGHIGPHRMGLMRTSSSQHSQRSLAQAAFQSRFRLSEQKFRVDKWSLCRVTPPRGTAEDRSRLDPGCGRQFVVQQLGPHSDAPLSSFARKHPAVRGAECDSDV